MSKARQPGTFPLLSSAVIAECMGELGMELGDSDLREPKRATMMVVYENFVDLLMGVSRDDAKQPLAASALEVLEHPELHDNSVGEIMFIKSLCKLMRVVGIADFSVRDVHQPEAKRTRRALSALINFAKFREERIGKYTEQTISTEELLDRREELELSVEQLQHRLGKAQAADERERDEARAVAADVETLKAEVLALNKKQAALQGEIRDAKAASGAVADKLKAAKALAAQEAHAKQQLLAQIVDDPEHVRREIADMREQATRERQAMADAERECHELQERLNTLLQIEKDVTRAKDVVGSIGAAATRRDETASTAATYTSEIKDSELALRELAATTQNVQFAIDGSDEKQKRLRETHAKRRDEAFDTLRECRTEKLTSDKERLSIATKISQQEIAAKQVDKKMKTISDAHAGDMAAMRARIAELTETLSAYHEKLAGAIAST